MRWFNSRPSPTYLNAVKALEELVRTEGTDAARRAYAEAVWERVRDDFARRHELQHTSGHVCVARLWQPNNRCPHGGPYDLHFEIPHRLPAADDHSSLWMKNGRPHVYVSQPYGLDLEAMRELVAFCDRYGLDATVNAWESWCFPGDTLAVKITLRELLNEIPKNVERRKPSSDAALRHSSGNFVE